MSLTYTEDKKGIGTWHGLLNGSSYKFRIIKGKCNLTVTNNKVVSFTGFITYEKLSELLELISSPCCDMVV